MGDFVAMGRKQCPACNQIHDRNAEILIHKHMKDIDDQVTGIGLCEEHYKEGFTALIEVDGDPNKGDANLTGNLAHMKSEVFTHMTGNQAPEFTYVEEGVIQEIENKIKDSE